MEVNIDRIKQDIDKLSEFNKTPKHGCTRFSYSSEDKKARDYLKNEMRKIDLDVTVDGIGNIRGRLKGRLPQSPIVITGSHIDTVKNGGKYDGIVGVVAGLESLRILKENNVKPDHSIELVVFAAEEGCNFDTPMIGSKILTGKLAKSDLKKIYNEHNNNVYEVAQNFGLYPEKLKNQIYKPKDIKAMVELHIEQGGILCRENKSIGVVEAIKGLKRFEITLKGEANHAGATPMNLRKDPLVASAHIIKKINKIIMKEENSSTVGTVGKIKCYPNQINVIPGKLSFTLDIRDVDLEIINTKIREVKSEINKISFKYDVNYNVEFLGQSSSLELSESINDTIKKIAKKKQMDYKKMISGASHDVCMFGDITDVGLIFIPNVEGRSHVPEEYTKKEDLKNGSNLLLNTLYKLAKNNKINY